MQEHFSQLIQYKTNRDIFKSTGKARYSLQVL